MKVITRFPNSEPREVELTDVEVKARDHFERLLDDGYDIRMAVHLTRLPFAPAISEEFLAWLAQ